MIYKKFITLNGCSAYSHKCFVIEVHVDDVKKYDKVALSGKLIVF